MRALTPRVVIAPPAPPTEGYAATYYVDPLNVSGAASDSNAGTDRALPWATMTKVMQAAVNDSRCYIRGPGQLAAQTLTNLTRTGWVTFKPDPTNGASLGSVNLRGTTRFTIWDGFTFEGGWDVGTSSGTTVSVTDHKVRNCTLKRSVVLRRGAERIDIEDFIIDKSTAAPNTGAGIAWTDTPATPPVVDVNIRRGVIRGVADADGIQIKHSRNILIDTVEIYDCYRINSAAHIDAIQTDNSNDSNDGYLHILNCHLHNEVVNPLAYDGQFTALQLTGDGWDEVRIENNLIHDAGTTDIQGNIGGGVLDTSFIGNTLPGGTVQIGAGVWTAIFNNVLWKFSLGTTTNTPTGWTEDYNIAEIYQGFSKGANSVVGVPTYKNSAAKDFRLAVADVLARNQGAAALNGKTAALVDRLGAARVAPYDIGCHEGGF